MSESARSKTLVIGASGFIGRAIVARLVAEQGPCAVVAGLRRPLASFDAAKVETRVLDATDPASLEAATTDISHLVNCVAGSQKAIVASTRACADVARRRRMRRLVHFSSIATYGAVQGRIDEDVQPGTGLNPYGRAKLKADAIVREAGRDGLSVVTLRPALVYGPESPLWTARIARLLRAGRLGDLGAAGEGLCNLVHVRDVAAATVAALTLDGIDGHVFNLAAPEPPSWNTYLRDFARALDLAPRRVSSLRLKQEALVAYPLRAMQIVAARFGLTSPDPITPSLSQLFSQHVAFDSGRAAILLPEGWTEYERGLAESAAWARRHVRGF